MAQCTGLYLSNKFGGLGQNGPHRKCGVFPNVFFILLFSSQQILVLTAQTALKKQAVDLYFFIIHRFQVF